MTLLEVKSIILDLITEALFGVRLRVQIGDALYPALISKNTRHHHYGEGEYRITWFDPKKDMAPINHLDFDKETLDYIFANKKLPPKLTSWYITYNLPMPQLVFEGKSAPQDQNIIVGIIDDFGEITARKGKGVTHSILHGRGYSREGYDWRFNELTDRVYWHEEHPSQLDEEVWKWLKERGYTPRQNIILARFHSNTELYVKLKNEAHGIYDDELQEAINEGFKIIIGQTDKDGNVSGIDSEDAPTHGQAFGSAEEGDQDWRYNEKKQTVYWKYKHPDVFEQIVKDWLERKGFVVRYNITLEDIKTSEMYKKLWNRAHGRPDDDIEKLEETIKENEKEIFVLVGSIDTSDNKVFSLKYDKHHKNVSHTSLEKSLISPKNWRMRSDDRIVVWWDNPTEKEKGLVKDYIFHKYGIIVQRQKYWEGGSTETSSVHTLFEVKTPTSDAFKRWFAGSKIVDEQGNPLVVYHGTDRDISAFDFDYAGSRDTGFYGKGMYFTPDPDYAGYYPLVHAIQTRQHFKAGSRPEHGKNIIPVYLRIVNPLIIDTPSKLYNLVKTDKGAEITERLKKLGYDGVVKLGSGRVNPEQKGKIVEIVAFSPSQIKSAIGSEYGPGPELTK